jgi:hypothetical protein
MKLIDTITVEHQKQNRSVMLFVGDLAQLPEHEAVDAIIVSAFPNDYLPTRASLIGSLARVGVSVASLAEDKEIDLRQFSHCWLSRPILLPGINFRRILCFEPPYLGKVPEIVGDIFRSIVPFTTGMPTISKVAMPLVASGAQGESAEVMLEALTNTAVYWLSTGLPLDCIKIVLHEQANLPLLRETFARVKKSHSGDDLSQQEQDFRFDVFISYSHNDKEAVDVLVEGLRTAKPSLRIFVDRLELRPGMAWQQHIFEALDASRKVICTFSPDYLKSKVCKEEYNIALFRHRESEAGVLLPVYLATAELPTYMKVIHYEDLREHDPDKISEAAMRLANHI